MEGTFVRILQQTLTKKLFGRADGNQVHPVTRREGSVRTFNVSVPFELSSSVYGTESALTLDKEVIKFLPKVRAPFQSSTRQTVLC